MLIKYTLIIWVIKVPIENDLEYSCHIDTPGLIDPKLKGIGRHKRVHQLRTPSYHYNTPCPKPNHTIHKPSSTHTEDTAAIILEK